MEARVWFLETRPHFLLLVPVSVLTGTAVAFFEHSGINLLHLMLAFVGGLLAHISVNVLNDYFDFKSGIDLRTRRTPFSGGSGILTAGLLKPKAVYLFGMMCLLGLIPLGLYFLLVYGWAILPLGVAGAMLVFLYTKYLTRVPWLCLLAPGLGFGPLMVLGTYFGQTGDYSWAALLASLIPGLLVSNLLLLNEFPDVEADTFAHRRHLPIVIGRNRSAAVFSAMLLANYACIVALVALQVLPIPALLGVLTVPLAVRVIKGVKHHCEELEGLVPFLAGNVKVTLATPTLMAAGIFLGRAVG